MISDLYVVAPTMRRAVYIFNYMVDLLHDYIIRCSRIGMEMCVCDIKTKEIFNIRFVTEEKYENQIVWGNHDARVMTAEYLEAQLDKLEILKRMREREK